jgi:hypothetical protein
MKTRLLMLPAALLLASGAARAQDAAAPAPAPQAAPAPASAAAPSTSATIGADDNAALFGVQGQLAVTDDLQLSLLHESVSKGGSSSTQLSFDPSLDYFVAPNVSVGATLIIEHAGASDSSVSGTSIGLGVRGGYDLRLTNLISFWPQLQLAYLHNSVSSGGMDISGYDIQLAIFAPFLFHPVPHFFVGIGPLFRTDLVSKLDSMDQGKTTDIGLQSVIGGHFGP